MSKSLAFAGLAVAASAAFAACGGGFPGSPTSANTPHPLVRQFSPTMSPIDFATGQASPTFTDPFLNVSTDPAYPGKIVVFFGPPDTRIDPATVFVGGNPALGIDLSALQIIQVVGGANVPLPPAPNGVQVLNDRIIFTPATLPLPLGQYSIGVFKNLKSVEGDSVDQVPAFHSFTVGVTDTVPPFVVTTEPQAGENGVGAGIAPPPPPSNIPASTIADVRTAIFGPTSPDIVIRFSESIDAVSISANTVKVVDAGAPTPIPPPISPAPTFPKLKSKLDNSSLPSNGFEVVWRADGSGIQSVAGSTNGLPFGTQVEVTVIGLRDTAGGAIVNTNAVRDRSNNRLDVTFKFQFQTIAPPDLPNCPEPEYAIYWTASDRVGVIDSINYKEIAATVLGTQTTSIVRNVLPARNDLIATKQNLGTRFDPGEVSVDTRTDTLTCHSFLYVQSFQSGQVAILNTRTMLPAALLNTSSPGGLSNQTGQGQAANVLLVTNSSAGTLTGFDVNNIQPGRPILTGPIFKSYVANTGNTPKAVSITAPATVSADSINREFTQAGPGTPLVIYADFADGVVNTSNLGLTTPAQQFALGAGASPNDIAMTPCFNPLNPILFAAISQGGLPGQGKVAYYVAGPFCLTGSATPSRPDAIVGDLSGFDAPAGLDNVFSFSTQEFFAMAESGSDANRLRVLGIQIGTINLPRIVRSFDTGPNPTSVAHRTAWFDPMSGGCAFPVGSPPPPCFSHPIIYTPASCQYDGAEVYPLFLDNSGDPSLQLYVCVRGAGRVEVMNLVSGTPDFYSPVPIPGVKHVGACGSQ